MRDWRDQLLREQRYFDTGKDNKQRTKSLGWGEEGKKEVAYAAVAKVRAARTGGKVKIFILSSGGDLIGGGQDTC